MELFLTGALIQEGLTPFLLNLLNKRAGLWNNDVIIKGGK
jgi:hypothetical protein